jgi:hypothetical protein
LLLLLRLHTRWRRLVLVAAKALHGQELLAALQLKVLGDCLPPLLDLQCRIFRGEDRLPEPRTKAAEVH